MSKELKIQIPNTLADITLGTYQRFMRETKGITSEDVMRDKTLTVFGGISLPELRQLKQWQVDDMTNRLFPLIAEFSKDQEFTQRFTLGEGENKVEYGFIPNLDQDISYGENKDITTHCSDGIASMHKSMAVLYRPITRTLRDTYAISKYVIPNLHEDALKEMPLSIALGANVFFWTLIKELLMHIPSYLKEAMSQEEYKKMMQSLPINKTGEDMMKSSALLKETLGGLMK